MPITIEFENEELAEPSGPMSRDLKVVVERLERLGFRLGNPAVSPCDWCGWQHPRLRGGRCSWCGETEAIA